MIAQLKYGAGTPFYRLEQLEKQLGNTVTGGDAVGDRRGSRTVDQATAATMELIRQAAQGTVVHNDDTSMRVLRLKRDPSDRRTGVSTTGGGIVVGRPGLEDRAVLHWRPACGREYRRRVETAENGTAESDSDVRCLIAQCPAAVFGRRESCPLLTASRTDAGSL